MNFLKRFVCFVAFFIFALSASYTAAERATYSNPLLDKDFLPRYTSLSENIVNVLLLGIDYGHEGYWGSGYKKSLEDCHTDAVIVIALNLDQNTVDLVSIPRDTLTYVPGTRGIYKLNGAMNCGSTLEDGFEKTCQAVSWILGGIQIDGYCAIDMNMMETLGDTIGGVDFELEMSYTGHSGTQYQKGMQHLDGTGIMDYLRSRNNATINANDIGRTSRQRALLTAIFEKLQKNGGLILKAVQAVKDSPEGFFTNVEIEASGILSAVSFLTALNAQSIGSYVITGKYRTALMGWNFTFTDQENRQNVLKEVYGIDADPLPYVSYAYTQWLVESGLHTIHILSVAAGLKDYLAGLDESLWSAEQKEIARSFLDAYRGTQDAFEAAADSMSRESTNAMITARRALQRSGDETAKQLGYPDALPWSTGKYWYADPFINEALFNWK